MRNERHEVRITHSARVEARDYLEGRSLLSRAGASAIRTFELELTKDPKGNLDTIWARSWQRSAWVGERDAAQFHEFDEGAISRPGKSEWRLAAEKKRTR